MSIGEVSFRWFYSSKSLVIHRPIPNRGTSTSWHFLFHQVSIHVLCGESNHQSVKFPTVGEIDSRQRVDHCVLVAKG